MAGPEQKMAGPEQKPEQGSRLTQGVTNVFDGIRRRLSSEQPTEEDKIWAAYMGKKRDWRELEALVGNQDLQPAFQQRAIEALLAPDITRLPFPINVSSGLNTHIGVGNHWVENITDEQAGFVAERIPDYIQQAGEVVASDEHNYDAGEALFIYNGLIPGLLGKLPPEQSERLFESFNINDPLPYWNMDTASGYNPLQRLYHNRTVDESWKRRAAGQMHEVIKREQRGEIKPRAEHEDAARNYGQALGMMLYGENGLPVSREFYQEEIAFMLGIETDRGIVDSWHTVQVLDLLNDPDLRLRFARRQVLTGEPDSFDRFKVYNDAQAETARRILGEFPNDVDLKTYLEQQLAEYAIRAVAQRQQQEQAIREEQDVLQRMRKTASA